MLITFFSNYFNHHQKALCDALSLVEGVEFYFVETQPMEEFRVNMGWGELDVPDYVIKAHVDDERRQAAMELARSSDAVIIGDAPEWYVEERIRSGGFTFRYTERPMKEGWIKMFIPRLAKKFYRLHYRNRDKQLYLLGASAYAAYDYELLKSYPGKRLKFGYFPVAEKKGFDEIKEMKKASCMANFFEKSGDLPISKHPVILYSGRFLKLKNVDLLVKACAMLKKRGREFELILVGNGEEEERLKRLVDELDISDRTIFHDFVSPDMARELMEKADIYVMTSGFLEGWGSVIYEAMSAGCAVVASHACGSTPWLITDKETGLIFKSGSSESLAEKLDMLLLDDVLLKKCQSGAYERMQSLWNPTVAATRIVDFTKAFMDGKDPIKYLDYKEGPLSVAPVIKNNWFK